MAWMVLGIPGRAAEGCWPGLAPQQEAAPHHLKKALVHYIGGRPPDAADHGEVTLGREKLLGGVEQQLRLHVVLEEQGEGAALRGALWGAQPPGYLRWIITVKAVKQGTPPSFSEWER